uniref:Chaperone protein dnaJ 6-like n=1 Tax=Dermatophagoides pteronyssinus TaxID=6956 RepID=A0A6P6XLJ8_DERPT|nr:chaperone protein dnaJ 6-like [Dermatophagoides pteronyssinus]
MVQKSYYSILNLDKNCSQADIVRAYRVLAIKYHPDKNSDGKELFQELKEAYEVLADEEKRYLYDNGLDYDNTESKVKITPEDIENFCRVYKGSVEEEHDIIAYYKKQDGNILKIFDHIPLLEFCEEHFERLIKMIEKLFHEKLLQNTREYENDD